MASTSIRQVTSSASLEEKKKLRKEFNYFDMIFYTLSALIGLDTLGLFSANGEQALTWMIIAAVTFLLPYGLLTAELGSLKETELQLDQITSWEPILRARMPASAVIG